VRSPGGVAAGVLVALLGVALLVGAWAAEAEAHRREIQDVRIGNAVSSFSYSIGGDGGVMRERKQDRGWVYFLGAVGAACLLTSVVVIVWASARTPPK
jgi:hypothetical protein